MTMALSDIGYPAGVVFAFSIKTPSTRRWRSLSAFQSTGLDTESSDTRDLQRGEVRVEDHVETGETLTKRRKGRTPSNSASAGRDRHRRVGRQPAVDAVTTNGCCRPCEPSVIRH